jgi:hypothetical protein
MFVSSGSSGRGEGRAIGSRRAMRSGQEGMFALEGCGEKVSARTDYFPRCD